MASPRKRMALAGLTAVSLAGTLAMTGQTTVDPRFAELARASLSKIEGERRVPGLRAPVEVIRDRWGVPHIYAQNADDLFMAQGYVMAQDRLWQMEMWRRQREGRLAEILGPEAVERDRIARLLKYRGPMDDREWTSYHPDGARIFTSFAAGVNAYIATHRGALPIEFRLTGITPDPWTPETVVLRTASFGNASSELSLARSVARLGLEEANRRAQPDPWDDLVVPEGLDVSIIGQNVTMGRGGRGGVRPELVEPYRSWSRGAPGLTLLAAPDAGEIASPGSNNWVVSGKLSATGKPVVVNDPHREVTNPSLRYIVHLVSPEWNVIGAGEPPFVGVAIGHNDRLGWGLTIVGTDQEDVYVEELNPDNPGEVRWRDGWEPLRVITEQIAVKGEAPRTVELKYSRHGPIFYEDRARYRAYALRSALLEPGTAPYLANLRLAQTRDCRAFLEAALFWKAPTENLICGDVDGNISWQASALTPSRKAWNGRLPVPGTGAYEWQGFRRDLPRELNPERGFIATANNNIQPKDYGPPIMFKSAANREFERIARLLELLQPGKTYTLEDHRRIQLDALSLRARAELALFRGWTAANPDVERARAELASWDAVLARDSRAAAIYAEWRSASSAEERDASRPIEARKPQHEASLARALEALRKEQGPDSEMWTWGRRHTRSFPHAYLPAPLFALPTVERPGGSGSVAADGASYREILDAADWDRSIATNVPGQSGQPESPFYGNLLKLWAEDEYFPLVYTRERVLKEAAYRLVLVK